MSNNGSFESYDMMVSEILRKYTDTQSDKHSNYFEFIVSEQDFQRSTSSFQSFPTSLEKERFYALMYKMMDTNYKYYQKQYKEAIIGDVVYQNYKNEEMSVFTMSSNDVIRVSDRLCALAYNRSKLSILSLPSTMNVYTENIIRKLIFRITNRVFVNFEHGINENVKYYKVFINYNHDKDVDVSSIVSTIKNIIRILLS
jgi:hypothetical protein